ncbi:hypothetical protein N9X53_07495 [Mariniblastus sp.]|nr:hypothetical protein [Mariniblastus sp.]
MRSLRIRLWLHPISTSVLLALAALFVFVQFQPKQGYFNGGATQFTNQRFFGWPRVMLDRTTTRSLTKGTLSLPLTTATTTTVVDELNAFNLCINMLTCVIATISTVFCIERWTRRSNRWQFGLRDIATALLVGSLVFAFYEPAFGTWAMPTLWLFPHVFFEVDSMPAYIAIPFFVCAYFVVYSFGAIVFIGLNSLAPKRPARNVG